MLQNETTHRKKSLKLIRKIFKEMDGDRGRPVKEKNFLCLFPLYGKLLLTAPTPCEPVNAPLWFPYVIPREAPTGDSLPRLNFQKPPLIRKLPSSHMNKLLSLPLLTAMDFNSNS